MPPEVRANAQGRKRNPYGPEFSGVLDGFASLEKFSRPLRARAVLGEPAGLEAGGVSRMRRSGVQDEQWGSRRASESRGREAKKKPADRIADGQASLLTAWTRRAQSLDGCPVDEAAHPEVEESAQLDELVHAHLTLPVQHVPEPLTIHADAACKLRDADASVFAGFLNDASCLQGVFRALMS